MSNPAPQNPGPQNMEPQRALLTGRIIWAALFAGQVIFLIVVTMMMGKMTGVAPSVINSLHFSSVGFLVVAVPVAMFVRSQTYKKNWVGNRVTPQGYLRGNLILWAACEGASLLSLIVTMLAGTLMPFIIPSAFALAVLVVNYPSGGPMKAAEPDLMRRD